MDIEAQIKPLERNKTSKKQREFYLGIVKKSNQLTKVKKGLYLLPSRPCAMLTTVEKKMFKKHHLTEMVKRTRNQKSITEVNHIKRMK